VVFNALRPESRNAWKLAAPSNSLPMEASVLLSSTKALRYNAAALEEMGVVEVAGVAAKNVEEPGGKVLPNALGNAAVSNAAPLS
jgi:hypothetical protein